MAPVGPPDGHIHGGAEVLHLLNPAIQRFLVQRGHFNEGVHIPEVLTLPIELVLDVQPGRYGVVQFLVVGAGVLDVAHPCTVEHSGFGDLRQHLFFPLSIQKEAERNAVAKLHQRG